MRLAKTVYENPIRMNTETTDVGHLAKLLESSDEADNEIAINILDGGLYYEVCSKNSGLYTKVKELSIVETGRGLRLTQTDVILDGNIPDGGYRGKAYRVTTPEVLEFLPGKIGFATVFSGESLALYFEIMDSISLAKLTQLKEIFEEVVN